MYAKAEICSYLRFGACSSGSDGSSGTGQTCKLFLPEGLKKGVLFAAMGCIEMALLSTQSSTHHAGASPYISYIYLFLSKKICMHILENITLQMLL